MSNEAQYYNPIIQAMIASSQLQQGAAGQKQQALRDKANEDARQKELDQAQQRLENEHDYQQSMVKNATDLLGAHIAQSKTEAMKLSLIHISEPTRQAEISYAVFCLK